MAEIIRDTGRRRFESLDDGEALGLIDYTDDGSVMALTHTFVPPEHRGGTIASDLVQFALDAARAEGRLVDPVCPYVALWIRRHPEYADLLVRPAESSDR